MAVTAPSPRKSNPGFLTDDELVASFCVRTNELKSIVEMLRECTGSSNQHQIVIGPRGSGKTSLLLRVAAEVHRDAGLSSAFFPVVFTEDSYGVATAGGFWLECLSLLADKAPQRKDGSDLHLTVEDLRALRDDRTLAERCLGALLDFSDREDRRLVLMVENLNMMFRDMADSREAGWRLRETLQTEPRIVLLASATSRFDAIDHPDHALYDLFRTLTLHPLDTNECAVLWEAVSGQRHPPEAIRSLEILTGGSPRLLAIVARFGGGLSFRELMANLLDLVDDHTEYFKSHPESLPAQERRVYLALADLWKPAFTKEIADRVRLETSKCSAQLTRLVERGAVQVAGGTARRKQYYLSERLYNIYYLLRRNRGPNRLIEALIRFMAAYYSPPELKDIGAQIAREAQGFDPEMRSLHRSAEAQGFDPEMRSLHRSAFAQLMELPALAGYREELLATAPADFAEAPYRISTPSDEAGTEAMGVGQNHRSAARLHGATDAPPEVIAARALFGKAAALWSQNRAEDTFAAFDELVHQFGESETPALLELVAKALVDKGAGLGILNRPEEALTACDEVLRRFGESETPALLEPVATALVNKGMTLDTLNRPEEALTAYDEVLRRFGESETPALLETVAMALVNKGMALGMLSRPEEALTACDEVLRRFGESETPALLEGVAMALVNKGMALGTLDRSEEALTVCDEVVRRFGESETPALFEPVAKALFKKGGTLGRLNRPEEALTAYDEVLRRFGESEMSVLLELVAKVLVYKGMTLGGLNRPEEALTAYDEVLRRFGDSEMPALLEQAAKALVNKGVTLGGLNRPEEALTAYGEVLRRFGESETPALLETVATALVNKGAAFVRLNRPEEALTACDEVLRRFGESETLALLEQVAKALVNKGGTLGTLNRPEEALTACDEVLRRFGKSRTPALLETVATALVNKGMVLGTLNRPEEALTAYGEVLRRFGESETPALLEQAAKALVNKGVTLGGLNRPEEALTACDEVVRRFGESEYRTLRMWTETALLNKAGLELASQRYDSAIETVDRALDQHLASSPENRWWGHLIRAEAVLASGDPSACEQDITAILAALPGLGTLPVVRSLDALMAFSIEIGPERMRELVRASPAADLLLPLTTALEREMGLEPRVAWEVEEVAEDIRRDLAKLKEARTNGAT